MTDKLRFALVGCGSQGRYLSEALALTGQAELVACCDLNHEAAQETARRWGYARAYTNTGQMLDEADPDAVIVATIHDQLQPCGLAVVDAGKHLFIEKPMALNVPDGRVLVDRARAAGVKIMVGYTLPFLPTRVRLKQLVDRGVVGDLVHITAGQFIGPLDGWLAQPDHGGGPLFYIGTHVIYQVLDLVPNRAKRVFAEVDRTDTGVDEACLFSVRFDGGLTAQIGTSQKIGGRYGWLDVLGSAGRLRSEWERGEIFVQSTAVDAYRDPTTILVPDEATGPPLEHGQMASATGFRYVRAWAAEFADFIAAIRDDRDPAVTGDDGLRVLEITDAVFQSGRTAQPVEL
ncbi:Gfo/Idh/MocA family protein [Planctomycetota bacterium]